MADAWTTLLVNSTLSIGHDAWEHLNAQEGLVSEGLKYVSDKSLVFEHRHKSIIFNDVVVTEIFNDTDLQG